jgi:hypothetical protein
MFRSALITILMIAVCLELFTTISQAEENPITVYLSNLDSIKVYKVHYVTGIFSAPEMDPRRFMPPDSLMKFLSVWADKNPDIVNSISKGIPLGHHHIVKLISTTIKDEFQRDRLIDDRAPINIPDSMTLGPNNCEWLIPVTSESCWQSAFNDLANKTANYGCLMEVVCAKGLFNSNTGRFFWQNTLYDAFPFYTSELYWQTLPSQKIVTKNPYWVLYGIVVESETD